MRLIERIEALGQIGLTDSGIYRKAGSPADEEARKLVISWMMEAGMSVRLDEHQNIIGRTQGNGKPVVIGSHIDTVSTAGKYDGVLGVLGGIEAVEATREEDVRPVEVCVFYDEENTMSGSIGYASSKPDIEAFLELHVEQGPILDCHQMDIGVVQGIVGQRRCEVIISGQENHAGTTPMTMRDDALVKAAKVIQRVNEMALETESLVATVGEIEVFPNAFSVVPGQVNITIQIRDLSSETMDQFTYQIFEEFGYNFKVVHKSEPALCAEGIQKVIESACDRFQLKSVRMPSRASHDAQNFTFCPMGMIFVPSVGGISHSYQEFTSETHCYNGILILTEALRKLS